MTQRLAQIRSVGMNQKTALRWQGDYQFAGQAAYNEIGRPAAARSVPQDTNTIGAALHRVRAWATANRWRKSKYARKAGIPDTTLRHFNSPDWNPTAETLRRLEALIPNEWQAGDPVPGRARA